MQIKTIDSTMSIAAFVPIVAPGHFPTPHQVSDGSRRSNLFVYSRTLPSHGSRRFNGIANGGMVLMTSAVHGKNDDVGRDGENPVKQTPNHFRVPYIGFLRDMQHSNRSVELARKYGAVYRSQFPAERAVIVTDLRAAHACLADTQKFRSRGSFGSNMARLFSAENLAQLDGKEHLMKRRILAAGFHSTLFPGYFDITLQSAQCLMNEMHKQTEWSKLVVNLDEAFRVHFGRVIISIVTSLPLDHADVQTDVPLTVLLDDFRSVMGGVHAPHISPAWRKALMASDRLADQLTPLVIRRIQQDAHILQAIRNGDENAFRALQGKRADVMELLIAASDLPLDSNNLEMNITGAYAESFRGLMSRVVGLWLAGFTTTAPVMLCCVKQLYSDPHILNALREEQSLVHSLTLDAINHSFPLLDSFVHEVLRMFPSASFLMRRANRNCEILGHRVRKDEHIVFDVWACQRDGTVFPNPDQFTLDRFSQNNSQRASPSSLIVFSSHSSPHHCLGANLARMEIKTTLAVLLRDFELDITCPTADEYLIIPHVQPKGGVFATSCRHRH